MLEDFLKNLASHTGIRLTPGQFGKLCIEATKEGEKEIVKEKLEAEAREKAAKEKEAQEQKKNK